MTAWPRRAFTCSITLHWWRWPKSKCTPAITKSPETYRRANPAAREIDATRNSGLHVMPCNCGPAGAASACEPGTPRANRRPACRRDGARVWVTPTRLLVDSGRHRPATRREPRAVALLEQTLKDFEAADVRLYAIHEDAWVNSSAAIAAASSSNKPKNGWPGNR